MSQEDLPDEFDGQQAEKVAAFMDYVSGESDWALDPRVEEELDNTLSEEGIVGMLAGGKGSEERIPLIEKFSPDENQWGGKSIFKEGQPRAVTLADNLPEAFPILKPSEAFIHEFVADYEMRLTSVDGVARDQLMRIFRAMFGAGTSEGDKGRTVLEMALSAGPEDND